MLASATGKLIGAAPVKEMLGTHLGFPLSTLMPIGLIEVLCAVLYAVPKTSVLGAILATAYMGGAVSAHVRLSEPFVAPIVLASMMWAGLVLRDPRIRALLPLRSTEA